MILEKKNDNLSSTKTALETLPMLLLLIGFQVTKKA